MSISPKTTPVLIQSKLDGIITDLHKVIKQFSWISMKLDKKKERAPSQKIYPKTRTRNNIIDNKEFRDTNLPIINDILYEMKQLDKHLHLARIDDQSYNIQIKHRIPGRLNDQFIITQQDVKNWLQDAIDVLKYKEIVASKISFSLDDDEASMILCNTAPISIRRLLISSKEYTIEEDIGTGSFGVIYKCLYNSKQCVAKRILKFHPNPPHTPPNNFLAYHFTFIFEGLINKKELYEMLQTSQEYPSHPHILKFYGFGIKLQQSNKITASQILQNIKDSFSEDDRKSSEWSETGALPESLQGIDFTLYYIYERGLMDLQKFIIEIISKTFPEYFPDDIDKIEIQYQHTKGILKEELKENPILLKNYNCKLLINMIDLAQQFLYPVCYLQENNLTNFDLKPANCVILKENDMLLLKLIDQEDTAKHIFPHIKKSFDDHCGPSNAYTSGWGPMKDSNSNDHSKGVNECIRHLQTIKWNSLNWDRRTAILIVYYILGIGVSPADENKKINNGYVLELTKCYKIVNQILKEVSQWNQDKKGNFPLEEFLTTHGESMHSMKNQESTLLTDMQTALQTLKDHCMTKLGPVDLDNNLKNLDELKKEFCRKIFPESTKVSASEDASVEVSSVEVSHDGLNIVVNESKISDSSGSSFE
tara:strand:+ start:192 stop:2138 length:1947 start_codon:yes stop_codon:yes gene_type:complete